MAIMEEADIIKAIKNRHSTRSFKPKPVEWDKIGAILESARHAPTSGNLQNFRLIIVQNKEKINAIAEACNKQYWIQTAPIVVVVIGDNEKAVRFYGVRGERLYTVQNCAAAIENMLITATELGVGSCWVGAFDEDKLKELLGIPGTWRPQAIIPFGYEDEKTERPPLYPLETYVFLESFGNKISDISAVMGYYSDLTEEKAKKASAAVSKKVDDIRQKARGVLKELREKSKETKKQ